ncbi:MAG: hypothetical protein AB1330_01400 [Bacillota bacterium]
MQDAEARIRELERELDRREALLIHRAPGTVIWLDESKSGALGFSFRRPKSAGKNLLSFVTVLYKHMTIDGFRLVQGKKGSALLPPSVKAVINGKEGYVDLITLSPEYRDALERDAKEAYRQLVEELKKRR